MEKASALDREMSECAHCECRATYTRRFGRGKAATAIWDKVSARREAREPQALAAYLYLSKMQRIADALPTTGHSMGSAQSVDLAGSKVSVRCERYERYAHSCKWAPTYGAMRITLSAKEIKSCEIIGGMATIIGGMARMPGVSHAKWIDRYGQKQKAHLVWRDGYIHRASGYHAVDIDVCARMGAQLAAEKKAEKKLQKQRAAEAKKMALCKKKIGYRESILSGNCDPGTKAFAQRHNLKMGKKYRFCDLLAMACYDDKKYIERIYYKVICAHKLRMIKK